MDFEVALQVHATGPIDNSGQPKTFAEGNRHHPPWSVHTLIEQGKERSGRDVLQIGEPQVTTQFSGRLADQGKEFRVKPFPLDQLGDSWCTVIADGKEVQRFARNCTANWNGYSALWAIENERLYLTRFYARDREQNELALVDVFGTDRLFAFWFTGELKSNMGERIYGMFEPTYEQNQVWRFEHGVVKDRYIRTNNTPEDMRKIQWWLEHKDEL